MDPETTDVNTDVDASSASTESTGESAGTPPANTESSAKVEQTLEDVVKAAYEKSNSQLDKDKEETTEPEVKEEPKVEETKVEEKVEEKRVDEKGPIPYERFAEVNQQKVQYEQQLEQQREAVTNYNSIVEFCQANQITPEEHNHWMQLAALSKSDPEEAKKLMQPTWERLQNFTGDALPADLAKAVEDGEITLGYAKKLAAAENKSKFGQQQQQLTQAQLHKQRLEHDQQQFVSSMTNSITSWINSKKAIDPDFIPKSKDTDHDGKFEFFIKDFTVEAQKSRINSANDLVTLADKVLTRLSTNPRFKTQTNGHSATTVKSTVSAARTLPPPKTLEEVVRRKAAEHGLGLGASRQ